MELNRWRFEVQDLAEVRKALQDIWRRLRALEQGGSGQAPQWTSFTPALNITQNPQVGNPSTQPQVSNFNRYGRYWKFGPLCATQVLFRYVGPRIDDTQNSWFFHFGLPFAVAALDGVSAVVGPAFVAAYLPPDRWYYLETVLVANEGATTGHLYCEFSEAGVQGTQPIGSGRPSFAINNGSLYRYSLVYPVSA